MKCDYCGGEYEPVEYDDPTQTPYENECQECHEYFKSNSSGFYDKVHL